MSSPTTQRPQQTEPKQTQRLHPLTPFIRGWVVLFAILIYLLRDIVPDGNGGSPGLPGGLRVFFLVIGAAVLLAALAGLASWYFTHYVIDDDELRIESGAIFKTSKKVPFERLQSVDIVQPFAARIFGLAELRMEVGAGDSVIKLRYLRRSDADRLRDYLLTRAHGVRASLGDQRGPGASVLTDLSADDQRLVTVDPGRLVGSFLLSSEWLLSVLGVVILLSVTSYFDVVGYAIAGLIPMIIGLVTLIGRRLIGMFNFTLAESPRGLRSSRGLTSLTSQSIPVDRIQGVKIAQSLLWRPFGWYKIDISILGYGNSGSDDGDASGATSVLLPVADADQVRLALGRILPGVDVDAIELHPSPRAARWIRWFDFWTLKYGYDDRVLVAEHGWMINSRNIVPHAKTQSVRIEQGPLQRSLGLADVHLDITAGPVNAVAHQISVDAARSLAMSQLDRARTARAADRERRSAAAVREDARDHGDEAVLARFGVSRDALLGSGGESEVYALDEQRVLRIYRSTHEAPARTTEQLRRLYDLWASVSLRPFPLEVPWILDAGQIGNRYFTVDRRFSGRSLSGWLAEAQPDERRTVLLSYLDAAATLQQLPSPTRRFARLIGDDPREFDSLAELLTDQLLRILQTSRQRLEQDVPNVIEVWNRLQQALIGREVVPQLVHGDVCPPNVYVSRGPEGGPVVTGVGDFSPHTLVADPLMDIAGAIAFLELEAYPDAAADAAWLTAVAVERYGPGTADWIGHYRVYYGFYFSDTYEFDPTSYAWCLRQLDGATGRVGAQTPGNG